MAIKTQESQPQTAEKPETAKTFDPKDIELLRLHQSKTDQLIIQLGQISLQKYQIQKVEDQLKEEITKLEVEEKQLASDFTSKYGRGTLDIESGNFTPED